MDFPALMTNVSRKNGILLKVGQKFEDFLETSWTPMTWSATKIDWSYVVPSGKLTELWKITILIGKTSINGPLSIAMFVYQRVFLSIPKKSSRILSHTQK